MPNVAMVGFVCRNLNVFYSEACASTTSKNKNFLGLYDLQKFLFQATQRLEPGSEP